MVGERQKFRTREVCGGGPRTQSLAVPCILQESLRGPNSRAKTNAVIPEFAGMSDGQLIFELARDPNMARALEQHARQNPERRKRIMRVLELCAVVATSARLADAAGRAAQRLQLDEVADYLGTLKGETAFAAV